MKNKKYIIIAVLGSYRYRCGDSDSTAVSGLKSHLKLLFRRQLPNLTEKFD